MQKSFDSGEWAPQLYSRVDMAKYLSGAALIRNFFVDYRGGVTSRTGTEYILQGKVSAKPIRLIPFRASIYVSYMLEFGDYYIRFYYNKAPVLEGAINISGATQANPCVVTVPNTYAIGDWVFINGVAGMTQLNGNYYSILAVTGSTITLGDLNGVAINSTSFGAYISGGTTARIYTLVSPYAAADIAAIKFTQNVNLLILCHPAYAPQSLTLITFNNWVISTISFGTTLAPPTNLVVNTTLGAGNVNYAYAFTSVDSAGNESAPSTPATLALKLDLRSTYGTNQLQWTAAVDAVSYRGYKSDISYFGAIPQGVQYGYIGQVTGSALVDSNIAPNFAITPPVGLNPFVGNAVVSITAGVPVAYTVVPTVTFVGGSPSAPAVGQAELGIITQSIFANNVVVAVGAAINFPNGVTLIVASVDIYSFVTAFQPFTYPGSSQGVFISGTPPAQLTHTAPLGVITITVTWGLTNTILISGGAGYLSTPTIVYNPAGGSATAMIGTNTKTNPWVPGFFQQRLLLAAATNGPGTINFSQPGLFFNFNQSNPIEPDDAIVVTLASGELEEIRSVVPTAPGLVTFTDKASWLITGGSLGSAISPSSIVANRQSFNGASHVPPILNNYDILYVEASGSAVRDANYNYYAQVFTGQDISITSSHLFYNYQIVQWAWSQAPFKLVWALRNDGVLLTLTYVKEEEFIAWAHHDTAGLFQSVATIPETTANGMLVDAIYVVVQRVINGNTVQYIERFADRILAGKAANAWCVDAAIQYSGSPVTTFAGAEQLAGASVTGLADGVVIPPFIMPINGSFTLNTPASLVTVGLAFTAQLQTLPLEVGEPTIQGKQKKISGVTVRVVDTLGLSIGSSFNNLVAMKDLTVGNIGSQTNQRVTDLVTGDARTFIDPIWSELGQFCIQQSLPLPATISGVIPAVTLGDTGR